MIYGSTLLYAATFIGCVVYLNRVHGLPFRYIVVFATTAAGAAGCFMDLWVPSLHTEIFQALYQFGVAGMVLVHFGFDRRAAARRDGPFERRLTP